MNSPRAWLGAMAAAGFAAVGAALVAQQVFDMRPCPWCILQRAIFVAIGLLCALGALSPARAVQRGAAALSIALATAGGAAALWQHFVAAKSDSCKLTLADKVINALGLEALWPTMFQVTASCADAAVAILGLPFEFWSLALFVLLEAAGVWSLRARS